MSKNEKLWGGRFATATHTIMAQFSASVQFDNRLYRHDIQGSIAHAQMLGCCQVITLDEAQRITEGLNQIQQKIESGQFEWSLAHEDVHMNIEAALIEEIGDVGKKLHTGRSRNDQIATDIRLYLREELDDIANQITALQTELILLAQRHSSDIMPGYTHMQSAQPVSIGHHLLAWNEMLQRDYERFQDCRQRINVCPLGSAALAGTSYPIDRYMSATALGFSAPTINSLDSVSDRDFLIEFNANAALLMVHLSRISEELILWSSDGFGFVDLGDGFCTGSSIMPQKKNPDVAELTRGKSSRVVGNLMSLLTLMKGQPLAYNRDNQEDKEPLFDSVDTLKMCLEVYTAMFNGIDFKTDIMLEAAKQGFSTATDLADYLVKKNMPFRDAHEVVGKVVAYAITQNCALSDIELATLQGFSEKMDNDVFEVLDVHGSVNARDHIGGTAPRQVSLACKAAQKLLDARESKSG